MTPEQIIQKLREALDTIATYPTDVDEVPKSHQGQYLLSCVQKIVREALALTSPQPAPAFGPQRCEVTGNLCGTDTRPVGQPCPCKSCSAWRLKPAPAAFEPSKEAIERAYKIWGWNDNQTDIVDALRAAYAIDAPRIAAEARRKALEEVESLCFAKDDEAWVRECVRFGENMAVAIQALKDKP